MSEQIKQALTLLTTYLRKNEVIPQSLEDEVCNLLGYDVDSGPEIPAGWRLLEDGESICDSDYFLGESWKSVKSITFKSCMGYQTKHHKPHIRQTINIDLDKQPKELVAFARDDNGFWNGYAATPTINTMSMCWSPDKNNTTKRVLMRSEHPTYFIDWEQTLLVRPETVIEVKS